MTLAFAVVGIPMLFYGFDPTVCEDGWCVSCTYITLPRELALNLAAIVSSDDLIVVALCWPVLVLVLLLQVYLPWQ